MTSLGEFETTLKEVVQAKRLSASKMSNLTAIAMKSMEHDTNLVAILYRTHKSLPVTSKVSSLYAFDALARAARNQVTKYGITGDINSEKGNAATFLLKMEGILEGLFQDLISTRNQEIKEKSKKVLDIWIKSNTFPSAVLTRLRESGKDKDKEVDLNPMNAVPRLAEACQGDLPPKITTPPAQPSATQGTTPPVTDPLQSTLLALLNQAAQGQQQQEATNGQTVPNTGTIPVTPQLDAAQLALLQQLAQTAKLGNPGAPQPTVSKPSQLSVSNHHQQSFPDLSGGPSQNQPPPFRPPGAYHEERYDANRRDGRYSRFGPSDRGGRGRDRGGYSEDRGSSRGFRGGYRGRGRGRWDDRDHDRYGEWDQDRNGPSQSRRSRSRSPRRFGGRQDPRPYSPPHRPSLAPTYDSSHTVETSFSAGPDIEKDEFGRDIRPSSPVTTDSLSPSDNPTQARSAPSVEPESPAVFDNRIPVSQQLPLATANTSQNSKSLTSSSVTSQQGLDKFDISAFDYTAPLSWEALGKMWEVTYGYPPSQEQLMQFVMSGGTVIAEAKPTEVDGVQLPELSWVEPNSERGYSEAGRGHGYSRGRGRGFAHGNYRNNHEEQRGYLNSAYEQTDAVVLGGGSENGSDEPSIYWGGDAIQNAVEDQPSDVTQPQTAGGRMQRVGDKWVFVRGAPEVA